MLGWPQFSIRCYGKNLNELLTNPIYVIEMACHHSHCPDKAMGSALAPHQSHLGASQTHDNIRLSGGVTWT